MRSQHAKGNASNSIYLKIGRLSREFMQDAPPHIIKIFRSFAFLEDWSDRTKQKTPNKLYEISEARLRGRSETWCSACSIQLTSRIVALSHYQGND